MVKIAYLFVSLTLQLGAGAAPAAGAAKTYTNPIIDEIGPADPCVIEHRGTYYLYPTGDNRSYHVYTSRDLVRWTKGPKVFAPGGRNVWAPDVFRDPASGRFYLYYTANKRIGVATADRPDGRFKDLATLVTGAIDAHMFHDRGRYYLYYVKVPAFRIFAQQMKTPLVKKGPAVEIVRPTEPWEMHGGRITEGPWMLRHRGKYYLLYSGSGAATSDYAVGYAVGRHPMGPFLKYPRNPIVARAGNVRGPGHCCAVTDRRGRLWMVYHQQKDDTKAWNRFLCLDPLWFDAKGVLHGRATRQVPQPAPGTPGPHPPRVPARPDVLKTQGPTVTPQPIPR